MALTQISTDGVKTDAISHTKLADNSVGSAELVSSASSSNRAVNQLHVKDEIIDEARLQISNAGSNGQFLQKQSGNTGGLTWATATTDTSDKASLSGANFTGKVKVSGPTDYQGKFGRYANEGLFLHSEAQSTHYNWRIATQTTVDGGFEIAPSTAVGGEAFDTAKFVIKQNGAISVGSNNAFGSSGQVLTSGGASAAPSWTTISAAPEVEAVASGTLATDDAVFFNVSGTVSKVVLTSVSDSVGSSVDARGGVSNSVSQWEFDSCRISDTTFAICWEKDGIKVVVGTISGTSISFGTILNTGNGTSSGNDFPLIDYCAKSGCLALAYKNGSNLSMRAIGVSGNSLTEGTQATKSVNFGTSFALACGNSRYGAAGPITGGLVYGRGSSSNDSYIYDFTISGTTVTIGSNATGLNRSSDLSNTFRSANMIYCPLRDGYVITYTDDTSGFDKYLWMDSLTRNSNNAAPSFRDNGGPLAASSMGGSNPSVCSLAYDTEHQNIAVAYTDNNNHTRVRKINFQSNYNLTDYDPAQFESGGSAVINWLSLVYQRELGEFYCLANNTTDGRVDLFRIETNSNGTELSYPSDSSHRTNSIVSHASDKITLAAVGNGTIVTTIPSSNGYQVNSTARQYAHTSKNVTPSATNFLGFSAGNYTNGQTAKIKIVGNTTTQSSLSPMSTYYITDTGTVSSTAGNPSIKAGYAISSTKMIITPQYMY